MLLASVVASFGVRTWLATSRGRDFVARQVEAVISDQIRGHLVIEHLDEVDLSHVRGRGVRFEDESGRPVLEADEALLFYELSEVIHGRFVSRRGEIHGGHVWIETSTSGEPLLSRAFHSAHPGEPGAPIGADVVHLEGLHVTDVVVELDLGDAPTATLRHVASDVTLRAPENGAAIVGTRATSGYLHVAAPIPFDLRVAGATLDVDGSARRRIHLRMPSHMGHERIGIEVTANARPDEGLVVDARIRPEGLSAMLAAAGMIGQATIAEAASGGVLDVTVEMQ
ncbi:MAG: hypothetical protein U0234_18030 [Sandaracinus sp.]